MSKSTKYPRTLHAQISLGSTSDDRFMPNGYLKSFAKLPLVITEKLDGQCTSLNRYGCFARSHAAPSYHPWDKPLINRWESIKNDLGDLEIFGENMYGIHSIQYSKLESYYYVFGIRNKDTWLSWEEVKFYSGMLDLPTVPEIKQIVSLDEFFIPSVNENKLLTEWFRINLGMDWTEYTNTSGMLGGFNPESNKEVSEGFVVRNALSYKTNNKSLDVSDNEFDNLFKLVRAQHVQTDQHWSRTWRPSELINYDKYKWSMYNYMSTK